MTGTVSTRWYFPDWLSDPGIRASSLAARGLWMDLLCIAGMNKGKEHGLVLIAGRPPTSVELARLLGSTEQEIDSLLKELARNKVFNRDKRRIIYSRRMVRAEKNRGNGRLGGNPNLLNKKENKKSVKPSIPEPVPSPTPKQESLFAPAARDEVPDERTKLFRDGLATLRKISGKTESQCRTLVGGWLKATNDDAVLIRRVIEDAERERPLEPVPWIIAALSRRSRKTTPINGHGSKAGLSQRYVEEHFRQENDHASDAAGQDDRRTLPADPVAGGHGDHGNDHRR